MTENLYYIALGLLFIIVLFAIFTLLPKKKYRSWGLMKQEDTESKIKAEIEANQKEGRRAFARFLSPAIYEKEAARIHWNIGTKAPLYIYGSILLGIAAGALMASPLVMVIGAAAGMWVPWFVLEIKIERYESQAEEQVEILIQAVSGSYAVSRNLTEAMDRATESLEDPIRGQWKELMLKYRTGSPLKPLLDDMQKVVPVREFREFSSVLLVVEQAGGDASETMKQVADVIQKRRVLKEEAKAEMADQRQSHRSNVAIAVVIILFFRFFQAEQYNELMQTLMGQVLLGVTSLYIIWSFKKVKQLTKLED